MRWRYLNIHINLYHLCRPVSIHCLSCSWRSALWPCYTCYVYDYELCRLAACGLGDGPSSRVREHTLLKYTR